VEKNVMIVTIIQIQKKMPAEQIVKTGSAEMELLITPIILEVAFRNNVTVAKEEISIRMILPHIRALRIMTMESVCSAGTETARQAGVEMVFDKTQEWTSNAVQQTMKNVTMETEMTVMDAPISVLFQSVVMVL
jgi:hypothetical protein